MNETKNVDNKIAVGGLRPLNYSADGRSEIREAVVADIVELQAENVRLREALKDIADFVIDEKYLKLSIIAMKRYAHAALDYKKDI
jgi:hypothetical protein